MRREIAAPPPIPLNIEELKIPDAYKYYKRTDVDEELFLLADSGIYTETGRNGQQRFIH